MKLEAEKRISELFSIGCSRLDARERIFQSPKGRPIRSEPVSHSVSVSLSPELEERDDAHREQASPSAGLRKASGTNQSGESRK